MGFGCHKMMRVVVEQNRQLFNNAVEMMNNHSQETNNV